MNRKSFLQTLLPATAGLLLTRKLMAQPAETGTAAAVPSDLREGNTIAITCTASNVSEQELRHCKNRLESWGFRVRSGRAIHQKWLRYAGTDQQRLADFQEMLDDDDIDAILFGRGGYGTMRIIDQVNWEKFRRKPKWLIGFSDITTIHLHVHALLGIPTIHATMTSGFSNVKDAAAVESLKNILLGKPVAYAVPGSPANREGNTSGLLVGGNLSILQACSGSKSDIDTTGKILLIEDVNEYKYCFDRMMVHLKRTGKLDKLAGLVVGNISIRYEKDEQDYAQSVEDIVMEKVREYDYPVCFNFPSGHIRNNLALKLGVPYELSVSRSDVILNEKPLLRR